MALMSLTASSLLKFGLSPEIRLSRRQSFVSRSSAGFLNIRAVQENGGPRRLVDIIRLVPDISRNYFQSPYRRALFGGISLLGGFYVAQTISLSFGALGVNDVIAAVVCVLLTEYVTRFYYSRPKVSHHRNPVLAQETNLGGLLSIMMVVLINLGSWYFSAVSGTLGCLGLCS